MYKTLNLSNLDSKFVNHEEHGIMFIYIIAENFIRSPQTDKLYNKTYEWNKFKPILSFPLKHDVLKKFHYYKETARNSGLFLQVKGYTKEGYYVVDICSYMIV